jgi:hypothetical protein
MVVSVAFLLSCIAQTGNLIRIIVANVKLLVLMLCYAMLCLYQVTLLPLQVLQIDI